MADMPPLKEITVQQVSYSGSDLTSALESELSSNASLAAMHVDVFVDESAVREPYLIWGFPTALSSSEPWEIQRTWPFRTEIEFQFWARPEGANTDFDYTSTQTQIGQPVTVGPDDSGPKSFGNSNISLEFTVDDGPTPVTEEIEAPDGSTSEQVVRYGPLQSAYADFESALPEDGESTAVDNPDPAHLLVVADRMTRRVDVDGVNDQPDGHPDSILAVHDQAPYGYCAVVAIMVNYGLYQPRRLLEFCRCFFDPIATDREGDQIYGFNTRGATKLMAGDYLESKYPDEMGKSSFNKDYEYDLQTARTATFLHKVFRLSLKDLPETVYSGEPSESGGLDPSGILAMMEEHTGWPNVSISQANLLSSEDGRDVLDRALPLAVEDEMVVLDVFADVLRAAPDE